MFTLKQWSILPYVYVETAVTNLRWLAFKKSVDRHILIMIYTVHLSLKEEFKKLLLSWEDHDKIRQIKAYPNLYYSQSNWAIPRENQQYGLCVMYRPRSASALRAS